MEQLLNGEMRKCQFFSDIYGEASVQSKLEGICSSLVVFEEIAQFGCV